LIVLLLFGLLFDVLIFGIVFEDLLVGKLRVDFDWFLINFFLLGNDSGLVVGSTHLLIGCIAPGLEKGGDVLHAVVGEEESCHRVEEIFVFAQVFLALYKLEFELRTNLVIFESMVVLNVVNKLF
jgi:hypothetical protein